MDKTNNSAGEALDLNKLEELAKAATPGPWEAKNGYGAGLEIYMSHPQYPDKDWPAFGTDSAWCKKGLVAYETWVQFPNEVRDAAQARNAEFIAAANPAAILELIALARSSLSANAGEQEPVAIMERFPGDQAASRAYTPVRPAWLGSVPPVGTKLYLAAPAATAEPTKEMLGAMIMKADSLDVAMNKNEARAIYLAALAEAPTAPTTQHVSAAPAGPSADNWTALAEYLTKEMGIGSVWAAHYATEIGRKFLAAPTAAVDPSRQRTNAELFTREEWEELSEREGAGEVDAKDAGALKIACAVNRRLGDALLGRSYLLPDDLSALKRFEECASDFDSGGHDVPKPAMARLREIGVVQSIGFGRHQTTAFGDYVLERAAGEPVNLPLMTLAERNAAAAIAAQPKDTTDTRRDA